MGKMLTRDSIFAGYRIKAVIGEGATGVVYKAVHPNLGHIVALKVIREELSDLPEYRSMFTKEARLAARINSDYVVKVWELSEFNGQLYISFEYVSGDDLRSAAVSLNFNQKADLAIQLAEGLKSAHTRGLIHGDLKPENIKVTKEGKIKIIDFGLAKRLSAVNIDKTGDFEGTYDYSSPEQTTGDTVSVYSDIFSYGIVLYELLTGERPFKGDNWWDVTSSIQNDNPRQPSEINKELPGWMDGVIQNLLEKEPSKRYENFIYVIDDINCGLEKGKSSVSIKPRKKKVTVVDIINLTKNSNWDYFCEGFTDDLVNEISRRTDTIISYMKASVYGRDIVEVFKICGGDYVISGSLMNWQERMRLRIKAYGIGPTYLTGWNYDVGSKEIFNILPGVYSDISLKLAELSDSELIDIEEYSKPDVAAYEFYLKGRNYFRMNKPEKFSLAEKMYKKALTIDPNLAYAHSGLSDLYSFQFDTFYDRRKAVIEKARVEALKALEISPSLPEGHRSLGRYYKSIEEYNKAEECLLKAVDLNPKYAIGYRTLAWLKEDSGDHNGALKWANKSRHYAPTDIETLLLLGQIYMDLRKYEAALGTLHKAIELEPDYGRAYFNLGTVYLNLGVLDLALENFVLAIQFTGDPNAVIDAGCVHLFKREYKKARARFRESIKKKLFPFAAQYFLGFIELKEENKSKANKYLEQSIKNAKLLESKDKERPHPHIMSYRAMALAGLERREEALSIVDELNAMKLCDGSICYNAARVYALLGDEGKMIELLKKAIVEHAGPSIKQITLDPHFEGYDLPL